MGTIKFEIDLPEFEKELSINVTIHRDGEVVYTTTSSSSVDKSNNTNLLSSLGSKPEQEKCISVDGDKQKEEVAEIKTAEIISTDNSQTTEIQ